MTKNTILNLIGGAMCVIGFGISGLVTFFAAVGIIWGYATRPTFSPDIVGILLTVLIGLLIGGIGVRIAPFGQEWLIKIENDKLIEKHKRKLAKEAYQKELEAAKSAIEEKKQSIVIMGDVPIVAESDDPNGDSIQRRGIK